MQLGAVEAHQIEGKTVITCVIPPQPSDFKPFKVGDRDHAYTRSADGDYRLSALEELYLVGAGKQPRYDRDPVLEADVVRDLAPELLEQYLDAQLSSSPRLRRSSRDEQLLRTNVVANEDGAPTVAAVYALGVHPQQFLPHLTIKAHVRPGPGIAHEVRLIDSREYHGPAPDLLDQAFDWVQKHLSTTVIMDRGHGRDLPELPAVAIRELIANAIVHRDLSNASFGPFTQIVKTPSKLILSNPGGLWGITKHQLQNETGLSIGQISPAISALVQAGEIMREAAPTSKKQRYRLASTHRPDPA